MSLAKIPRGLSYLLGVFLATAALLGGSGAASAQKAAILTAVRSGESGYWQYVKQKIVDTGLYPDGVTQIDCAFSDPTLAQLTPYKLLVVMSSDYGLSSADGIGNAIGDYMAMVPGGSVLMFQPFTWQTGLFGAPAIAGKFLMNNALTTQGMNAATSSTKRGMVVSNDPLVSGVPEFSCGSNCSRVTGTMPKAGAIVSAYWADGTILAVRGKNRVDLNMWPADDSVISGSYKPEGGTLITNAILYLSVPVLPQPRNVSFPGTGLGGSSAPTTIRFKNISDKPLDVTGIGIDGTGKSQFTFKSSRNPTVAAPYTLPVGSELTVDVAFKPQVQGTHSATLFLTLGGGLPRVETPVQGVSKGNLYISLSPIDFGGIPSGTEAGPVTVRIKNTGAAPVDLDKPVLKDTTHYVLTTSLPDAKISMASGATYSFDVKFTPGMTAGDYNTEITVTSTDASSPLTIPVLGLAGPPKAQVPYRSLLLSDVPTGAKGLPLEITISNPGYSELQVTEISAVTTSPMMGMGPDFEIPNAPTMASPLKIKARETKNFQLVFAPQLDGLRTGKLTLKTNEPAPMMGTSDIVISLAGIGTKPQFKVGQTELDFKAVNIGAAVPTQNIDLINSGDGDLLVKEVSIAMGPGSDSFTVATLDPVPFVLRAGATVPVTVAFVPKSAGMLSATLRVVTDLVTGGSAMVALKGEANGAVGKVSPATLNFGDQKVKQMVTKPVTLTNTGNKDLTILRSRLTPTVGIFAAMLPADGTVIKPGMNVTINVTCMPAMVGAATGSLLIETDDPAVMGGTKFTVPINVNGVVGNVTITPLTIDFMTPLYVGQKSDMQTVKVTNSGNVVIDNLAVKLSGTDSGDFTVVTGFKTKLMAGESTDIGFVFEPRVAKMMQSATVVIEADGVQVPMTVALKASSLSPLISVNPGNLKFDRTVVGKESAPKYLVISNDGGQPLELAVIGPPGEDWAIDTSDSKLNLMPGDQTRVAVVFAPKATGSKSESIEIRLKGTNISAASIGVEGEAVNPPPPPMMNEGCSAVPGQAQLPAATLGWALLLLAGLGRLVRVTRKVRGGQEA